MENNLLHYLRKTKDSSGLSYKDIAEASNGMMSVRTIERIFTGKAPLNHERWKFLCKLLDFDPKMAGFIYGPEDASQVLVREVLKMDMKQQVLLIELCREINKKPR